MLPVLISASLHNLVTAVSTCFHQLGKMEDLEEAITYHRQALVLRPPGHPDRSTSLNKPFVYEVGTEGHIFRHCRRWLKR
jgi:hypothetical protein